MNIGASSSCFYPLETEKALERVGSVGIKTTEVFFNSPSELEPEFLKKLCEIKNRYSMDVTSVHPFMSFSEGYNIFSSYNRRFYDSLEFYKNFFEAAATLGAKYFVLHGSRGEKTISDEEYANRLLKFIEEGETFGVHVTHENVVRYSGETPQFMQFLRSCIGEKFKMTLDLKQARRAGIDPFEFVEKLGTSIAHVHVSDFSRFEDCLPPGENGLFDFERFFEKMKSVGYDGNYIVELYRNNFKDENELKKGVEYLRYKLKHYESLEMFSSEKPFG